MFSNTILMSETERILSLIASVEAPSMSRPMSLARPPSIPEDVARDE
jgi:hypothetical protein